MGRTPHGLDLAPQAAGLLAASLGYSRLYREDLSQFDAAMGLYDAFYRWARDAAEETHNWPKYLDRGDAMSVSLRDAAADTGMRKSRCLEASLPTSCASERSGSAVRSRSADRWSATWCRKSAGSRKEEMRDAIAVSQSLPGPLAIQVGIFISYMRGGFWGAWAGGWAFILPNFLIVCALGALYVHFGGLPG